MAVITTKDWTLDVDGEQCAVRLYKTKTKLRGDEASHMGTELVDTQLFRLGALPAFIREHGIKEFAHDDDMRMICDMPADPT